MSISRVIEIRGQHNKFIDALKGYAILFVLINHTLPLYIKQLILFDLWGGQAVPLFLLIQVFHSYKYGLDKIKPINWKKVFFKLISPFILAESIIVLAISITEQIPLLTCVERCVRSWGLGPGEYYIWEYFQFMLLLPIMACLYRKLSVRYSGLITIAACIFLELLSSCMYILEHTYKFLFFRYFFLIYLGYCWALNNIVLDKKYIMLSCLSIVCIIVFDYTNLDLSPLFYESLRSSFHWICYFYSASLFIFLIKFIHNKLSASLRKIIELAGQNSWIIFCAQMSVYYLLSPASFKFTNSVPLQGVLYFIIAPMISILAAVIYCNTFLMIHNKYCNIR